MSNFFYDEYGNPTEACREFNELTERKLDLQRQLDLINVRQDVKDLQEMINAAEK